MAGTFTPVEPVRILDTRDGTGVAGNRVGPLGALQITELQVTGANGIPATGVGAATLNVTVTQAPGPGYVTVYPCGEARPNVSTVNYIRGVDAANQVSVKVGAAGRVCFFASTQTEIIADLNGWWTDNFAAVPGFHYEDLSPARILDSRDGTGMPGGSARRLAAGEMLPLAVAGVAGVAANAAAISLNMTATNASSAAYLTVVPCGRPLPVVSNLNYAPGVDVANLVTSKIGAGGAICIYSPVDVDVIADVAGYFRPWDGTNRPLFTPLSPQRVLDTRDGTGIAERRIGPLGNTQVIELQVRGVNDVPAEARAVALNVTVTSASGPGHVTVYPCGIIRPIVSNLNFVRGVDRANAVKVRIGADGRVCFFASVNTHIIADQFGYFAPAS